MESTESEQQLYYNDNDHLPVFRNGLTCGLSTKEIVTTLKTLDVNDKCVAKVVSASVSHNVAFVLDVTSKYRDLFIDMAVRNNRSELAIANHHQK